MANGTDYQTGSGASAGIRNEQVVSIFDYLEPQYWNEVGARFGYQFDGIYQILRALERETPVAADEWHSYEENRYSRSISVHAVSNASPSQGAAVVVTIESADHELSGTASFPRAGEMVLTVDEIPCLITLKSTAVTSAHTITIAPVYSTDTLPDLTDTKLIIFSGASAAGMGQPDSVRLGKTKRSFVAQIIKESIGQEGTQFVNQEWTRAIDDGRDYNGWYNPGLMLAEYRLNRKIDGAFTWGKTNTSLLTQTTARGSVNVVKTTKGIVPWITELGKSMTYTPGAFDIADLDDITLYQKQQGVTSGVGMILEGPEIAIDIRNAAKDYIDGNGTDYTNVINRMFGGNEALALSVNFKVLNLGDFTYIRKEVPAWSDPTAYAETGFGMPKYAIVMPLESYKDPDTNEIMPNVASRYRALGSYSRRFEVWHDGAAGGDAYKPYIGDIDEAMLYLRSHLGLQALKMNRAVIITT
jgi:hypothetical protein